MLAVLKNNRSLTFYQQPSIAQQCKVSTSFSGGIGATTISATSFRTAMTTTGYNEQLQKFLTDLHNKRAADASRLDLTKENSSARSTGVKRAWEYEKADVEMGGKGSANWTEDEREQIRQTGRVRGAEGHHQKNAADHPEHQADPDNIKFYKDRESHRVQGHQGNFQNESDSGFIDKDEMLKKTNSKRVWKNELTGIGIAVAVGAGIGLTIGFVTTLAQSGVTPDSLKLALAEGAKGGLESGLLSAVGYGIGRTLGEVASKAAAGVFENLGLTITDNISMMINMGVVGTLTIIVFSTYQFIKMKIKGVATKDALIQVGKQALFSLSLLAVSIAVQGAFGGVAGIIVSVSVGIILISYSIADSVHQRRFAEGVRVYMIEKCRPSFLEVFSEGAQMKFDSFVKQAVKMDNRNVFSKCSDSLDRVPNELKAFYREYNPTDVEVGYLRFSPLEEIEDLQEEFAYLKAQFIFATTNGDPVFLHDGHVYTCPHGVNNPKWELLANDVEGFFDKAIQDALE